jgi:general secretion pathway protein A
MYCPYFGFAEEAFGVCPDARFFFSSSQHAEASASLYYAVSQRRGFAVLIGAPGLGKTSILVHLAESIAAQARVAFFVHPEFEGGAVLESVLLAMGLEPEIDPVRRHRQLHAFLLGLQREGKTCVVIFDEAQHLNAESLETIRMLSNFETPRQKLVQFILAGQPALGDLLRAPECEQILQRVNIIAHLEPLGAEEVGQYIAHRTQSAGAIRNPFSPEAIRAIAAASKGVPRNINTLCFNALTLAFADEKKCVDAACVAEVVKDRMILERRPPVSGGVRPSFAFSVDAAHPSLLQSIRQSGRPFFLAAAFMLITVVCVGAAFISR